MRLAYLDAGSGSMIVQAVVAGTAGMAVAVKLYWRRLTGRFRRGTAGGATDTPATETPATETPVAETTVAETTVAKTTAAEKD